MRMLRRLIGILVLVMVVLAMVQMVGAETAQRWYLLHDEYTGTEAHDGTTHHKNLFMNKIGETSVTPWSTYFNSPKTVWWYAGNIAECNLGFGENDWTAYIAHGSINTEVGSQTLYVDVYKVKADNSVVHLAGSTQSFNGGDTAGTWDIVCTDDDGTTQDFTTGERLAFRITHSYSGTKHITIYYYKDEGGKRSRLESPSSDPGYPVPELSALLLFSIGLITLTGYVLLTKKRRQ